MSRGRTVRTALTLLVAALLALPLLASTGSFAAARTLSDAQAKAERGITSPVTSRAEAVREGLDALRAPGRPDAPGGVSHLREHPRRSSACCAEQHPPIAGRAAGAGPSPVPVTAHDPAPRALRAHTPAALQVFRR